MLFCKKRQNSREVHELKHLVR